MDTGMVQVQYGYRIQVDKSFSSWYPAAQRWCFVVATHYLGAVEKFFRQMQGLNHSRQQLGVSFVSRPQTHWAPSGC